MDKWGNSATWNSDAQDENGNPKDRFWITKKLDLYAKWRQTLDGAAGIGVIYDANGGSNAPTDPDVYEDTSTAVAGAASSAPEGDDVFLYWVIQKWNNTSGQYEDVTEAGSPLTVKPGGDFTVLKDYAKVIVTQWCNPSNEDDVIDVPSDQQTPGNTAPPDNTHTKIKAATYTMQLRAEYGQPENTSTQTHIYWYANNDEGTYSPSTTPYKSDTDIAINQAVNIPDVPSYEGHEFKGWAKLNEGVVTGYPTAWDDMTNAQQNTFKNNMFLTYDNGTYTYNGKDVTQVMADETRPYQDLYAVWEKKKYDVKIIKAVTSESEADKTREYSFTAIGVTNYSGGSSLSSFRLTDTGEKEVEDILYGETISFQETDVANYNVTISASYTDEAGTDHSVDIPNNNNNSVSYKVLGDTTITITNTRKVGDVDVTKIVSGNMGETDKNFSFTASIKDGQNSLKLIKADDGTIKVSQEGGEGSIHFNLTHEQTKQFKDLPVGAVLMIEEDEYGDYAQSYKIGEGSDQQSRAAQVTVNNGNTEIVFTNDKTVVAPTQLYSGTGPMAVLVVFSLGALILLAAHHFIDRFRHRNNM